MRENVSPSGSRLPHLRRPLGKALGRASACAAPSAAPAPDMLTLLLLPLYVAVDSARALIGYVLLRAGTTALSPTLITFACVLFA